MRGLSTAQLFAAGAATRSSVCANLSHTKLRCGWAPVVDGVFLTDFPWSLLSSGDVASKVPVIAGSNANEARLFLLGLLGSSTLPLNATAQQAQDFLVAKMGAQVAAGALPLYPVADFNDSWWQVVAAIETDASMACPARRTARGFASAGAGAFLYQFSHEPDVVAAVLPLLGAAHGMELAFVFQDDALLAARERPLAAAMGGMWTSFAASGRPSAPSAPAW